MKLVKAGPPVWTKNSVQSTLFKYSADIFMSRMNVSLLCASMMSTIQRVSGFKASESVSSLKVCQNIKTQEKTK